MKKITKLFTLLLLVAFSCIVIPQKAQAATSGFFEYEERNGEIRVTKYNGGEANVKIPSKLGGKTVKCISWSAFARNDFIETVYVPDGVTSILSSAFSRCENSRSLSGCKNVTWLDTDVFYQSKSFTTYPFTSKLKIIGAGAFKESAITNVKLPSGLEAIYDYGFEDCDNLKEITLPAGIDIGDNVFMDCDGLKKVVFGNVKSYDGYMFRSCDSLETVVFCSGVRNIDGAMFYDCKSLKSVTIPNTVRTIGWATFQNCTSLTSITIPYGVIEIGDDVFRNSGLKSLVIPNSVNKIGSSVFYEVKLDWIQIPKSVTYFESDISSHSTIGKVRCYAGTAAERFAKEKNVPIEYLTSVATTKLTFDKPTVYMNVDDMVALNLKKTPTNTTDAMIWQTTADNIATVNGMGEVVGKSAGSCTIVVKSSSGVTARINVVVSNKPTSIAFNTTSKYILKGNKYSLKAIVKDEQGVRKDVIPVYTSSNTNVAKVDGNGNVTTVGKGSAIITAQTSGLKAQYKVVVYSKLSKATCKSLTSKSKAMLKTTWKKVPAATGYEVQYSTSSKFKGAKTKKLKASASKVTIKKLKSGNRYYVRIRAVGKVNGKKVASAWSNKKVVRVK